MKRSSSLKLSLMMGAGAMLTGCGDDIESALLFQNVDDCTNYGFDAQECQFHYQDALANHAIEAPRYNSENLCESDFGYDQCESSSGIWRPIMAGFMVAMIAEAVDEAFDYAKKKKRKVSKGSAGFYSGSKPLYRSKDDFFNYRSSSNALIGSIKNRGTVSVKKSAVKYTSKPKTVTSSRGGFGKVASSRSYGG
jgi:uncharacterized protein YgiB involved in biofilm formation